MSCTQTALLAEQCEMLFPSFSALSCRFCRWTGEGNNFPGFLACHPCTAFALCNAFFPVITFPPLCPSPPPPPVSIPPPRGGTVTWPMNNKKSIGNHRRAKALKKIFSWVILELAGREWCTVPPPQGVNRRPLGGDGHGGGKVRFHGCRTKNECKHLRNGPSRCKNWCFILFRQGVCFQTHTSGANAPRRKVSEVQQCPWLYPTSGQPVMFAMPSGICVSTSTVLKECVPCISDVRPLQTPWFSKHLFTLTNPEWCISANCHLYVRFACTKGYSTIKGCPQVCMPL